MKNFFRFFALAAFALVAGVSCQEPEPESDPAVLTVGEVAVVSAAGGQCSLTYSIENPVEGQVVTATVPAEATWVSNITVGESAIEFTVAANNGAARSTVMTVSYANLTPAEVTISQAKANGITVGTVAEVAAAGGNASFTYSVVAVEGATLTATVAEETTWIHDFNVTETAVEFVVDANTATAPREAVMTLAYADESKAVTVRQAAAVPVEEAFEVSFSEITPTTAKVTIVPKDPTITYMIKNTTSSSLNSYEGATPEEKAAAYAISQAGTWLFPFWGTANMDNFVTGNYPRAEDLEGSNELSWVLYSEDEIPYMLVAGINVDEATDKASVALTTPVSLVEVPLLPKPVVTTSTETLEVSHEAGSNGLTFNVENAIEGIKVEASTKATWIKNINIVNDKVAFEYDANPYAAPRQAAITFQYEYADEACTLTVMQAGNPNAEQHKFYVTVKELHYDNVVVDVTPSNPNVKYIIGAVSEYTFNGYTYNGSDMTLVEKTLTGYSKVVKTGAQTDLKIPVSSVSDTYGWNAYIYVYAIDDTEKVAISALTKMAVTLINDQPSISFTCDDPNAKLETSSFGTLQLTVLPTAGTYTFKYIPNNLSDKGLFLIEPSTGSSYSVIVKDSIVHDKEAHTVTFTTTTNETTSSKSDYIFFKYYSDPNDTTFTDLNKSLKISQPKQ